MPFQGSAPNQTYVRTDGVRTGTAVNKQADIGGVNNTAALADARENDFATAINLLFHRGGGNTATADLPMGNNKLTSLSIGSARTDSVRLDQVQDGDFVFATVGGTADAITLDLTPNPPVYSTGMHIYFIPAADNTGAVTVNLDGIGVVDLEYQGAASVAGQLVSESPALILYDGTAFQLLNPPVVVQNTDLAALSRDDGNFIVGDGTNFVAESGATAQASLGVEVGVDVQAFDEALDDISALAVDDGNIIVGDGTNWVAESGETARTSLGVVTAAEDTEGLVEQATDAEIYSAATGALGIMAKTWKRQQHLLRLLMRVL